MSEEKEKIVNTIKEIQEGLDLFYQQKTVEALKKFDEMLEAILSLIDTLFSFKESHDDFMFDEEKIKTSMTEAMGALEEKDMILLADIIQYDFVDYIEELIQDMA